MAYKKFVAPGVSRAVRRPTNHLAGVMRPFGLYPMSVLSMFAGETHMYSGLRGRYISQPIKHPITGGWLETWAFQVPLRLITGGEALVNDIAPAPATAVSDRPRFFTNTGQADTLKKVYDQIVSDYFTPRSGASPLTQIDGVQRLPIVGQDWAENLQLKPATLDSSLLPQQAITEALTGLDFESERILLESQGYREFTQHLVPGSVPDKDDRARLVSYQREWKQPQNVIDPASGSPRSSFYFEPNFAFSKPFKAKEHSVVMFLMAFRPHLFRAFEGSFIGRQIGLKHWLPPRGEAAWDTVGASDPIFPDAFGASEVLVYDRSDYFTKGETLINCTAVETPYPVPRADTMAVGANDVARGYYASDAEIDSLFVGATPVTRLLHYQAVHNMRIDGVISNVAPAVN